MIITGKTNDVKRTVEDYLKVLHLLHECVHTHDIQTCGTRYACTHECIDRGNFKFQTSTSNSHNVYSYM